MKKISISLLFIFMIVAATFAQVNTTTQNGPNSTGTGYQLEFKGSNYNPDNCPGKMPYNQWNLPDSWATYSALNDTLTITTNGTQTVDNAFWIRLFDASSACNGTLINLKDNQHVKITIKSSIAVPQCLIMFADKFESFASNNPIVKDLVVGDNIIEVNDIDFSVYNSPNKIDSTQIALFSIRFRNSAADANVSGTFKISKVELGAPMATTTGVESTLAESTLKYFPNPVQDQLSVSFLSNERTQLVISDMSGRKLKTIGLDGGQNDLVINTSDMMAGIYLMSIKTSDGIVSKLITVTK